jgi:hypothetical protein
MVGDTIDPATEKILIDHIATDVGIHNAGDLRFGVDGYLYITVGDSGLNPSPASRTTNINGKILRILPTNADPDGYVTTGNPFDATGGARRCGPMSASEVETTSCKEIYAYGFRNPFRFTIKPGTSTPYVGDVGGGAWEEINEITSGGDFGYPACEGDCAAGITGKINPIHAYAHVPMITGPAAVIGGDFYTGVTYPAQYQGALFFADYVLGWVKYLTYNSGTNSWTVNNFATGGSSIIGMRAGPSGDLYYLVFVSDNDRDSEIRRISYAPGINQPPIANASVTPLNSASLSTVYTFSAAGSIDPDNNLPLLYNWDFGDGSPLFTTSSVTATHTYTTAGPKTATLTITDDGVPAETSAPDTVTVYPGNTPPTGALTITNTTDPARTNGYYFNDHWTFNASGVSDDKGLAGLTYSWDVVYHHNIHTHPVLNGQVGPSGALDTNFTEPATDVWYRVIMHITDADGQTTTLTKDIYPIIKTFTVNTDVPGATFTVDGVSYGAPLTTSRAVGFNVTLDVPSPQTVGSNTYIFASWSQGGAQSQTLAVPVGGGTFTARLAGAPTLVSPADNTLLTEYTPTLDWNDPALGLDHYQLQIDDGDDFSPPVIDESSVLASTYTLGSSLNPVTRYFWRVRAFNSLGHFTSWSLARSFKTAVAPPVPDLPNPVNNPQNLRPFFDWNTVAGADSYSLQVAADRNFTSLIVNMNMAPPAHILTSDLPRGTTLYWRVRSNDISGYGPSNWSAIKSFDTPNPPTVPTLLSPVNGVNVNTPTPTLDWTDSSPTPQRYEVEIATDNAFVNVLGRGQGGPTAVSQYTPETPLAPGTYYWRVRAYGGNSPSSQIVSSDWSMTQSFRIP